MKMGLLRLASVLLIMSVYPLVELGVVMAQEPPPPPAKDYFPATWDEYSYQGAKFRIRFPGVPKESANTLTTPNAPWEVHSLQYNGLLTYRISYVDYKTPIDDPLKVKDLLQGLKANALKALRDK